MRPSSIGLTARNQRLSSLLESSPLYKSASTCPTLFLFKSAGQATNQLNLTKIFLFTPSSCCRPYVSRTIRGNHEATKEALEKIKQEQQRLQQFAKEKQHGEDATPVSHWLYIFPIIAFGLGTWQIFRRKEKHQRIRDRKERLETPLQPLPATLSEKDLEDLAYRPVECKGVFLLDKEMLVRNRSHDGVNGVFVITPFKRTDDASGGVILVNRGWAPSSLVDSPKYAEIQQPKGEIILRGIVRPGEAVQFLQRQN